MKKLLYPFFLHVFIFTILISYPVLGQTEEHRFIITSPRYAISNIPFDLHIHALIQNGQRDTSFTGYINSERIARKINEKTVPINKIGPFIKGKALAKQVVFQNAGTKKILLKNEIHSFKLQLRVIPGFLSLLPPILAVLSALIFRQVLISLFAGIWLGTTFLWGYNPFLGLLRTLDHYITASFADKDHATIIIFTLTLGGMVGIISRSGGTQGMVQKLSKLAKTPNRAQFATWIMGIFIFFDDYANTLIVGNTMRPITDKLRISREKLSYIVDSTAAPVASLAVISTWIGFELGLIQSALQHLNIDQNIYLIFLQTIPYRFYSLFAIIFVFLIATSGRDFSAMLTAEQRARKTGHVLRPGSVPLSDLSQSQITAPKGIPSRWFNAVIPILTVIITTIIGLWYNGRETLAAQGIQNYSLRTIIGAANPFSALMWSSFAGAFSAGLLAITQRILNLRQTIDAWISGAKSMIHAFMILVLAWTIGSICKDLHTADYIVSVTSGLLSPQLLPSITFVIAAFVSFATGTSWGTMSILMPIIIPAAHKFSTGSSLSPEKSAAILIGTIASVLSGSVFGDHCSPISDTTIMSSMASGSDHVDHVRTQLPYAILVAAVAFLTGYLPSGFGLNPVFSITLGIILLTSFLLLLGQKTT